MTTLSPTTLLLGEIIQSPSKAESILESLTAEQIMMIETTIHRVKRRKMDKSQEDKNPSHASAIASALAAAMVSAALQSKASHPAPATSGAPSTSNEKSTVNVATTTNATAMTTTTASAAPATNNDPVAEVKDGVEWVSFVYSHNRTLKRYSIRTDIQNVVLEAVDDKFKAENCVRIDDIMGMIKFLFIFLGLSTG